MTALYTLLPFILRKDLGASMLQISLFLMLRPVLPLFSFYWSHRLAGKRKGLVSYLLTSWVLAYLPMLLLPVFGNYSFLLLAAASYQIFSKAATPAVIEILRRKVPKASRDTWFSLCQILSFLVGAALALTIGRLLDTGEGAWRWLLSGAALLALTSTWLQRRISLPDVESAPQAEETDWAKPWKESLRLIRSDRDFAHFQWAFMIGGSALMMMAPALAAFYADRLEISHTDLSVARLIFMALGVAVSSLLWRRGLHRDAIHPMTALVLLGFGLFPLMVLFSSLGLGMLNAAFFLYGIAQAGSHLLWNLSGTVFAQEQDCSSPFTSTNLCMIGIRGVIAPLLGGCLCEWIGPVPMLLLGSAIACGGAWYVWAHRPLPQASTSVR